MKFRKFFDDILIKVRIKNYDAKDLLKITQTEKDRHMICQISLPTVWG